MKPVEANLAAMLRNHFSIILAGQRRDGICLSSDLLLKKQPVNFAARKSL